jgi:hypothetical protein
LRRAEPDSKGPPLREPQPPGLGQLEVDSGLTGVQLKLAVYQRAATGSDSSPVLASDLEGSLPVRSTGVISWLATVTGTVTVTVPSE